MPRLPWVDRARWMAGHWAPYRWDVFPLVALTLANALVLVSYPYLMKRVIDGVLAARDASYLFGQMALILGIGASHCAIYATLQCLRTRLIHRFEFGVRLRAFEHALRTGPRLAARFRTGDLVTRLTDDVSDKLSWYMSAGLFRTLEALLLVAAAVTMMLSLHPRLTLYTAGPLPLLVGLFVFTAGRLHEKYEAVQDSISRLNEALESCFSGIRVVKAFAAEAVQRALVHDTIHAQRRAELRAVRWQTVIDSLYGNLWQLAIVGVLLAGGAMVVAGEATLGDLVAFESYVMLLVVPMFDIGQFLVRGKLSAVSIDRIQDLERTVHEPADDLPPPPTARRPDDPPPDDFPRAATAHPPLELSLASVTYRFPGAHAPSLVDVSFRAEAGRRTALVGEVGAGKSTLLALVPRLFEPDLGELRLGGRPLAEWDPVELRQQIGYVPQEAQLLSGTLRENIRFGRTWITDADLEQAIEVAQLRAEIAGFPEGLETLVGNRGLRLSGGQKQRAALARALAGRPKLLLLDDCTASLDAETEAAVWRRLAETLPDCTTLFVTHRPATLEQCRHIVLLDRGHIVEQGSFAALNRPQSLFRRLYAQWQLQEEVER